MKTRWENPPRWEHGTIHRIIAKGPKQCRCVVSYDDGTTEREDLSFSSWPKDWDVAGSPYFPCPEIGLSEIELTRWVNVTTNAQDASWRAVVEARGDLLQQVQQEAAEGRRLRSKTNAQSASAAKAVRVAAKAAKAAKLAEDGEQRAAEARSHAAHNHAEREQLFCMADQPDHRLPRVQPRTAAHGCTLDTLLCWRTGVAGWLPQEVVSHLEHLIGPTALLVWRLTCHAAFAEQQQRDAAILAQWRTSQTAPPFVQLSQSLLHSTPLCPRPPRWLRTLLAHDGTQVPTCIAYIDFARRSDENAALLSRRVWAQAQLQQLTTLLQLASWSEVAAKLGVAADDEDWERVWHSLQAKCQAVQLCETFPMHLGRSSLSGEIEPCPDLHMAEEVRDLELVHAHFVCEVPLPKPSCRGSFPMGASSGARGKQAVLTARHTLPSMAAVEAALQVCPPGLQSTLQKYLHSCRTRFTIILDFFEAMQRCAQRCTLAGLGLSSLLGDSCLSSCGYTISSWDVVALGAVLSGPGVRMVRLPRNAVANGHDIWWPAKGCARRIQASSKDGIAPHDVGPFSFGPTNQFPLGLNLRDLPREEQVLLFYLALPAKQTLVLSPLLQGSHSICSHDVGSAVAAACTAHHQGLLQVQSLHDLQELAKDELALWRRMAADGRRVWTVAYIGRTVGPYVAPKTKVVSIGHLGRAHSYLMHTVDDQGRSTLKGLSLPGTAKPPHGKLVEVCSDAISRSRLSKPGAQWHPFSDQEKDRAWQRARLIYTKARIVALEGSQEQVECVESPHLGAVEVRRPGLAPSLGDGTLSFEEGGIRFLDPYLELARRELGQPGGLVELLPSACVVLSKIASDHIAMHTVRTIFPKLAHLQGAEMHNTACNNGLLPHLAALASSVPPKTRARAHTLWVQARWPCPKGVDVPWAARAHRLPDEQEWEADKVAWASLQRVGQAVNKLLSWSSKAVQKSHVDQLAVYSYEQVAEESSADEESEAVLRLRDEQDAVAAVRIAALTELATPKQKWALVQLLRQLQEPGKPAPPSTTALMFSRAEIDAIHVQNPTVLKAFPKVGHACRKGVHSVRRAASLALFDILEGHM